MAEILQFLLPLAEPGVDPTRSSYTDSAPEDTLSFSDPQAREAALDISRSWIVEAPAGSGKTGLLIQRLLKLLAFGDVHRPGEVMAITFTRKATTELRTRVLEQLVEASSGAPLPVHAGKFERITREFAAAIVRRDRERGWRLLDSPQQLNIRTIDSFCAELTGNLPLLSRGTGRREPVEDASPLYEEAATRTLEALGGFDLVLDDALRCVLIHRDGQVSDCVRLISSMLGDRDQWGELVPLDDAELTDERLDGPVRQRLENTIARVIREALAEAQRLIPAHLLEELAYTAARLSTLPGYKGEPSPIAGCAGLSRAPGTDVSDLQHWLWLLELLLTKGNDWRAGFRSNQIGFDCTKEDQLRLEDLVSRLRSYDELEPGLKDALSALRELPPPRYPEDQWIVAKALFRVLKRALLELQILFGERGVCDFTEIGLAARALLKGEPDALHSAGGTLTHLLVDEMQDTSAAQYQLLELLSRGWDGRTQTVFLVGDPKQSIYLFRQARVARFLRTQFSGRLGGVPLGALRLTANFRSQAELVQEFNHAFEQILPHPEDLRLSPSEAVDVPFVAATATRSPGAQPALHWHTRIEEDRGHKRGYSENSPAPELTEAERQARQLAVDEDALAVRRIVEDFRERWQQRSQVTGQRREAPRIAVLARNRSHLAPIVREFHQPRGSGPLAFRAVEIELLDERPEVLDLLALTRALLHPGDRVAWLALLHSPVCGLGRADLLALTGEPPEGDPHATVAELVATRSHLLSPEGQRLLQRAWPILATAIDEIGRTLFSTHVERTWRSLGGDALLCQEDLRNALRFLRLLQQLELQPEPLTPALLKRRMSKLYAESSTAPDAVDLMTIHKAKGLEWDLVLVPALERKTGNNSAGLLNWLEFDAEEGGEAEVILAPIQGKGEESTALSKWLLDQRRRRERAEAKRIFYVACTRAREELHLFGTCGVKKTGELAKPDEDSLLGAAWNAARPAFEDRLRADSQEVPTPRLLQLVPAPSDIAIHAPLALAASADETESPIGFYPLDLVQKPTGPALHRLPYSFDPLARFRSENGAGLPYPPASALRQSAPFTRPEGSFGARAFGNTVHRFLDLISRRLAGGADVPGMMAELPSWKVRLETALRSEGLPRNAADREAARALDALRRSLEDPAGRWLLSPRAGAQSERSLQLGPEPESGAVPATLRADRIFLAGPHPQSKGVETHLWIVDFKTSERGGRLDETFLAAEKSKYEPQLRAYARALAAADQSSHPIVLALFYPLLPQMLYWPFEPKQAS